MVEAGFSSCCRVDVLQELFANSPDLAFGRVNESASGFVLEVVFMVLECYKSLSFSHTFCPVGNVQVSGDVFGFVVNSVDCVGVGFLVGRCDYYPLFFFSFLNRCPLHLITAISHFNSKSSHIPFLFSLVTFLYSSS